MVFTSMEASDGILKVSLTATGMPYLDGLKKYYSLHAFSVIMDLRSSYAIRLYLILYQFRDTGWANMTVDELRKKLKIEDKYKDFYLFRKKVLQKAQDEIHEKTNIQFSWSEFKKGRRIHRLYFEIFEEGNTSKKLDTKHQSDNQKDLFPEQEVWRSRLKNLYQLNDKKIDEIFKLINSKNYEEFTKIFHQMELKRTNKEVRHLPGFAVSMLINNLKED